MDIKAIVFDFDGVIAESVNIKTEAFQQLFSSYQEHHAQIMAYLHAHYSYSRFVQFRGVVEGVLKQPYTSELEQQLNEKFSQMVVSKIIACPFVPGAVELLKHCLHKRPMYIVSLTPDQELKGILSGKGVDSYFKAFYGSTLTKAQSLREIMRIEKISPSELIFIGDALSDFNAAKETGVCFVARAQDQAFNGLDVLSFEDLHEIKDHLIHNVGIV